MPFARLMDRLLVVSPVRSPVRVGMPYGSIGAFGASRRLAGSAVQLRRTPYDAEAACKSIVDVSAYPDVERWVQDFVRSPPSDTEALAAFTPRPAAARATSNPAATST
jgi:hypothetical protein